MFPVCDVPPWLTILLFFSEYPYHPHHVEINTFIGVSPVTFRNVAHFT